MATSNDSTVVLRLPQDLKNRLQEQAEQLDMSLSEIIRLRLMIADDAVHKEPVIRLGQEQYRLWDVLRPDVLAYDLVESRDVATEAPIFSEESGAVELPICGVVTKPVQSAISRSRDAALRLGSTEISPVHVAIALLEVGDSNAARAISYLCGSLVHVQHELEAEARAFPSTRRSVRNGDIPLAKATEKMLKLVRPEARFRRRAVADTAIVLLALLRDVERTIPALAAQRITYTDVAGLLRH